MVIWFAHTREAAGIDWKAPTTASAWRQLQHFLWPEIHKWVGRLRWDKLGGLPWREGVELLDLAIKLRHGEAFAVASNKPALMEGAHADHLLYTFDEAKAIPAGTFDAAEGAFSNAGSDTGHVAYALACSTPGDTSGRFYEIQRHAPGTEDWWARAVTLQECIDAGRVSQSWADQRRRQWGEKDPRFINRVLGDFAGSPADAVIPLSWVEAAIERWREWDAAGRPGEETLTAVGVDLGHGGDDSILALRHDWIIGALENPNSDELTGVVGRIAQLMARKPRRVVIDAVGLGAGPVDQLREMGFRERVVAFVGSERTEQTDRTGDVGFVNCRTAAYWHMRELLDPDGGEEIMLPPDDILTGDLTAPKWHIRSGGKIALEDKDDQIKRTGHSPDRGDAVVMAYWVPDRKPMGGVAVGKASVGRWTGARRRR